MAKSVFEEACALLDQQIAELQRSKDIIIATSLRVNGNVDAPAPKKRGRKPKRGLPATESNSTGD